VIMMSGHGTIDTAVEATKFGAMAFLEKPITLQKLLRAVEQALTKPAPRVAGAPLQAAPSLGAGAPLAPSLASMRPDLGYMHDAAPALVGHVHLAAAAVGPQSEQSFELDRPLREARDAFEKSYFEFHLAKENGSMTRVAEKTGLERTHLYRKLKQLGVDLTRNKRGGSA